MHILKYVIYAIFIYLVDLWGLEFGLQCSCVLYLTTKVIAADMAAVPCKIYDDRNKTLKVTIVLVFL